MNVKRKGAARRFTFFVLLALTATGKVQAQEFQDAAVIFYDAYRGRDEWVYDKSPQLREGKTILSEDEVFTPFGLRFAFSKKMDGELGAELLLSPSQNDCKIEVVKRIVESTFEDDSKKLSRRLEEKYRVGIPENVRQELKNSYVRQLFYLNHVLKDEIRFRRSSVDKYEFYLTGIENLVCEKSLTFFVDVDYLERFYKIVKSDKEETCTKEMTLTVSDKKLDRFKNVLSFIYQKNCVGSKRQGRF